MTKLPLKSNQHDKPGKDQNWCPLLRKSVGWMKFSMQKTAGKDDEQEVTVKTIFCPLIVAVHTYCRLLKIKFDNYRSNATKTKAESYKS